MRILIVDDHSLFRDGIVSLLGAAGFDVVGQAEDGEKAVAETLRLRPDLVLLDINMPGMNGLDALSLIRESSPATQVVMLTAADDDQSLVEAVHLGASGFLHKNLPSQEFIAKINGLAQGEAAITLKTAARLMTGVSQARIEKDSSPGKPMLSAKEVELLPYMCMGLTNKEIGTKLNISENTVKYHLKNILQKLNLHSRAEIVVYAVEHGYFDKERTSE